MVGVEVLRETPYFCGTYECRSVINFWHCACTPGWSVL